MAEEVDLGGEEVNLTITKGSDADFDVEWWEEDGTTPIVIASFEGYIADAWTTSRTTLLDLANPITTINGNILQVRIPGTRTDDIEDEIGVWALFATAMTGEVRCLARGRVRFQEGL